MSNEDAGAQLSPAMLAAIQEAIAQGFAGLQPGERLGAPPEISAFLTTTPKLGLKMPALDDPALITDINDNMVILDESITATQAATLTNKTLTAPIINNPTINGWTNANHTHLNAAGAGPLDGAAITTGTLGTGLLLRESGASGVGLTDPIVRDTLNFGAKPSGASDASIARTGAGALRVDTRLALGINLSPWAAGPILQLANSAWRAALDYPYSGWTNNSYYDGTHYCAVGPSVNDGGMLELVGGALTLSRAPGVAGGAIQTFVPHLNVGATGTLTLTPDAGQQAMMTTGPISVAGNESLFRPTSSAAGALRITPFDETTPSQITFGILNAAQSAWKLTFNKAGGLSITPDAGVESLIAAGLIRINSPAGAAILATSVGGVQKIYHDGGNFLPGPDNSMGLGSSIFRWTAVYAVAGSIQTSVAEMKRDISHLDPAACAEAVLATDWVSFSYLPTPYQETEPSPTLAYDASDSNEVRAEKKAAREDAETKAKAAHVKMLADTKHTRDQRGYVLQSSTHKTHDLFGLSDRASASPSSDLAVVACALQQALLDIADLKAQLAGNA